MKILRHIDNIPREFLGGAVSIGNFDGVHRGHARIIERLKDQASAYRAAAIVFTFDPHPVRLLRPDVAPPPLTWTERKAELLEAQGVNAMIAYPTDERLLSLTPREFFDQIIRERLAAKAMVEGPNFFFGNRRSGDVSMLAGFCHESQISLTVVEPLQWEGGYISSSRVRDLIHAGAVGHARQLLTQPYRIHGLVTHGAARGSRIGFPTANIEAVDTLVPAQGVYAGRAFTSDESWPAAINIGPNPTFGEHVMKVEAHLIGFSASLYGKPLEIDFLERLRDIRPFASVDELKEQLARDVTRTREICALAQSQEQL
jgi:riboflavin kinase/FMN adenylyltransferase